MHHRGERPAFHAGDHVFLTVDTVTVPDLRGTDATDSGAGRRSMYWDSNGFTFSGGTNATGIALPLLPVSAAR